MSLLGADLMTVTSIETKTTANSSQLMQARYGAEAGVQRTINWLSNNYTARVDARRSGGKILHLSSGTYNINTPLA